MKQCDLETICLAYHEQGSGTPVLLVPVLVICGSEDQFSPPSEMSKLTETAKRGIYVEIPDSGHLPPMEQPELFVDAFGRFR